MEYILNNLKTHFPLLPQKALMMIYEARFERSRMLMHKGIHVELHWLIEAKVRLAGDFSYSFIAYMPSLGMLPVNREDKIQFVKDGLSKDSGKDEGFEEAAKNLGKMLAKKKIHLVYRGGNLGLIGCVSKTAHDGESQVLGIIPKALATCDIIGDTVGEVKIVSSMHKRNVEMLDNADAFIVLPSGLGTLDELFEGFISPLARRILVTASTSRQLIEQLEVFVPQYDHETSQLDWSIDECSKRRRLD
ncbi:hypothetical protein EZV62_024638 [Acer yangbiense]|uniref:cytokinin riboside 5'-monophosphate phosphoribohydrolase n=1 Tax=Acer yangbiense TaxID=1000413 RepID=A0A5C7GVN5_9ROSI|nr:hypothetical protein EZV62_024638 [Acer yangbiense]